MARDPRKRSGVRQVPRSGVGPAGPQPIGAPRSDGGPIGEAERVRHSGPGRLFRQRRRLLIAAVQDLWGGCGGHGISGTSEVVSGAATCGQWDDSPTLPTTGPDRQRRRAVMALQLARYPITLPCLTARCAPLPCRARRYLHAFITKKGRASERPWTGTSDVRLTASGERDVCRARAAVTA